MYRFSRAIYREVAVNIAEDPHGACPHANHERVLRACESAVERLATDRHYFARPSRTLAVISSRESPLCCSRARARTEARASFTTPRPDR